MLREIIEIDEELCDGCGQCIDACAEGAIQLVDGKARVIKEEFCDGLGACIGDCPTGALEVVEREAPSYDAVATEQHVEATRGLEGVARFRQQHAMHQARQPQPPRQGHDHGHGHSGGGCPGSRMRDLAAETQTEAAPISGDSLPSKVNQPDLAQWPIQLHLVPPRAPFFEGKELVLLSTCGPVASADVHWRFLRGRSVVVACPKLDQTEPYLQKLAGIFANNAIPRVEVVRMEVPCCGGLTELAEQARRLAGRNDLVLDETVIGLDGAVRATNRLDSAAA